MRLLLCVPLALAVAASTVHADPPKPAAAATDDGCGCSDPGHTRRTAAKWVALGGLALGTASFVVAIQGSNAYHDALADYDHGDPTGRERANDAVSRVRYLGTGLVLGSAVALGISAYLYFTAPSAKEHGPRLTPVVSREQSGLAMVGTF